MHPGIMQDADVAVYRIGGHRTAFTVSFIGGAFQADIDKVKVGHQFPEGRFREIAVCRTPDIQPCLLCFLCESEE